MSSAAQQIQARIAAVEAYDAIVYGERALKAGYNAHGCELAGGWMAAQLDEGLIAAAMAIGKDDLDEQDLGIGAAWLLKRGKKEALEAKRDAEAAVKAIGTRSQLRLAMAA
jgi:hypothetical protein